MSEYHVEDSLVPITKGKEGLRGFGFEPAFNEFYDLYASDRVLSKPILRLEDIALYLYLRKCVNVERDDWRPPSMRHLARKFKIGTGKVYRILERLEKAHLLRKVSGVRESGNMPNQYTLFDPLSEEEFVRAAEAGALPASVRDDWRGCARERTGGVPEAEQGVYLGRNRGVSETEQGVYLKRNRGVPEVEQLIRLIDDYRIDGALMHRVFSCRTTHVGQINILKVLKKYRDIPSIILESDIIDVRSYSEAEVKMRIDAFVELMAEYKKSKVEKQARTNL